MSADRERRRAPRRHPRGLPRAGAAAGAGLGGGGGSRRAGERPRTRVRSRSSRAGGSSAPASASTGARAAGRATRSPGRGPYRPGDRRTWIDWRASARLSAARGADEFVVREFFADTAPRVVLAVDRRPRMGSTGRRSRGSTSRRRSTSAVAAIGRATVAEGGELAYVEQRAPARRSGCRRARRALVLEQRPRARLDRAAPVAAAPRSLERCLDLLVRHALELPRRHASSSSSPTSSTPSRRRQWLAAARAPLGRHAGRRPGPDLGAVVPRRRRRRSSRSRRRRPARSRDVLVQPSRGARARAPANEERLEAHRSAASRRLGFDPVVLGSSDPDAIARLLRALGRAAQAPAPEKRVRRLRRRDRCGPRRSRVASRRTRPRRRSRARRRAADPLFGDSFAYIVEATVAAVAADARASSTDVGPFTRVAPTRESRSVADGVAHVTVTETTRLPRGAVPSGPQGERRRAARRRASGGGERAAALRRSRCASARACHAPRSTPRSRPSAGRSSLPPATLAGRAAPRAGRCSSLVGIVLARRRRARRLPRPARRRRAAARPVDRAIRCARRQAPPRVDDARRDRPPARGGPRRARSRRARAVAATPRSVAWSRPEPGPPTTRRRSPTASEQCRPTKARHEASSASIPLGDAAAFGRRARLIRRRALVLAASSSAALASCLVVALRQPATSTSLLPASSSGIVVLDVSASISSDTYARIAATLDRLVRSNGSLRADPVLGHRLPGAAAGHPGARAAADRALLRRRARARHRARCRRRRAARGRTRSAPGRGSRRAVARARRDPRATGSREPAVLLVSDLDDDTGDLERVSQVAIAYRRAGIPLHVVGLNAAPEDERVHPAPRARRRDRSRRPRSRPSSRGSHRGSADPLLVVAAVLVALGLAAFLLVTEPLRWSARVRPLALVLAALRSRSACSRSRSLTTSAPGTTPSSAATRSSRARRAARAGRRARGCPAIRPPTCSGSPTTSRSAAAEQAFVVATPRLRQGFDNGRRALAASRRGRARALATSIASGSPAQASQGRQPARHPRRRRRTTRTRRRASSGAAETFDAAIRADGANADAKYNLELLLRRIRVVGSREGAGSGSGDLGDALAGAGCGTPGSGY